MALIIGLVGLNTSRPATLAEETVEVAAGQHVEYGFTPKRDVAITLALDVTTGPAVNVRVMNARQKAEFDRVQKKLLGGTYHYMLGLSRESIRTFSDSAVLAKGEWWIVIQSTEPLPLLGRVASSTVTLKIVGQSA